MHFLVLGAFDVILNRPSKVYFKKQERGNPGDYRVPEYIFKNNHPPAMWIGTCGSQLQKEMKKWGRAVSEEILRTFQTQ